MDNGGRDLRPCHRPSQCRTGASRPLTKLFPDDDKGCGRLHVNLVFTTSDNRTFMHLVRVLPGRIFLHAYALHCACVCVVMRSCSFHLEKKWPPPGFTSPKWNWKKNRLLLAPRKFSAKSIQTGQPFHPEERSSPQCWSYPQIFFHARNTSWCILHSSQCITCQLPSHHGNLLVLYILPLWHKCHGWFFISPCIPDNWSRLQILQLYYLLMPFKNMSQLTWCLSLTYSSVGERLIFLPFLCSPCLLVAIYETGHGIPVWSHNIELL